MHLKAQQYIFLLTLILFGCSTGFAQKKWPGKVLYSIERNGITGKLIIDPIVRISKGVYSYPVPTPPEIFDGPDANKVLEKYFNRFCKEEYRKNRKFDLFIDGNKCGGVTTTQLDTLHSCSPVVSEVKVTYKDSARLHFIDHGLVIASLDRSKPISRFSLDTSLELTFYQYAKDEFLRRGVKKDLLDKTEITDIRVTDLNGDGKPEYLVTYALVGEEVKRGDYEGNIQYSVTLILEPTEAGFKQLYSHYPDPAIPEETHTYKFTDVIDLDGDGICEVIIQRRNYSSWAYVLLKKKGNVWEEIYEGAGGGC